MWNQIPNFSKYAVGEEGQIKNVRFDRLLNPSVKSDGSGVPIVTLIDDTGETHILEVRLVVAAAFLGTDLNARPKPKIEYIDGNKFNNAVSNLRIKVANSFSDEIWKPIPEFETSYAVSNKGRVKRLARIDTYTRKDTGKECQREVGELILKVNEGDEYYSLNLREGDKSVYRSVHRLVAEAFVPRVEGKDVVNHKDGNKHNNCAENLEWVTNQENIQHAWNTGLKQSTKGADHTQKQIKCIETGQVFDSIKQAAEAFDGKSSYLHDCLKDGKEFHGYHFIKIDKDRRVKCLDTGIIYESLTAAEEALGRSIGESIKRRTCVDGWTYCWMKDNVNEDEYLQECRNRYSLWPRAIDVPIGY